MTNFGVCGFAEVAPTPPQQIERHMTGAVLSSGVGPVDLQCVGGPLGSVSSLLLGAVDINKQAFSFSMLDADGVEWRFSLAFEGDAPAIAAGDTVSVDFAYQPYGFFPGPIPGNGTFSVRNAQSELLVWAAQSISGALPSGEFAPPEISLQEAPSVCEGIDFCHAYRAHDVTATVSGDGGAQSGVVPYGGSTLIGGYELRQNGVQRTTGPGTSGGFCANAGGRPEAFLARRTSSPATPGE